jgi:RimJ/RimL family protein N-acetyltransferase
VSARAGSRAAFLQGERVALRPVADEDVPCLARWWNDGDVTYYMFTGQRPVTVAQAADEMQRQLASPSNAVFIVQDRATGEPIGTAGLYDIHATARKAEFRTLLGERAWWNRGYGTEATEALVYYGFDRLNLNKVWLGVIAENAGAVRAYEKSGFRVEGRLREELYRNSRYYDSIRMSVLRSDYYPDLHAAHASRFGRGSTA